MVKIGSIVVRCYEFDKMLRFWQEALHYMPSEPATEDWVVLRDPALKGTELIAATSAGKAFRQEE